MPVPLDQMPSTFGLTGVEDKPFFPHLYNRTENLVVILPHLPQKDDYIYRAMKPGKKEAFDLWYEFYKFENSGNKWSWTKRKNLRHWQISRIYPVSPR
jgi:hypothetical protein